MEKIKAKKLSLNMEYRINMSFNYKTDQGEYLDKFKKVLRYLKVREIFGILSGRILVLGVMELRRS